MSIEIRPYAVEWEPLSELIALAFGEQLSDEHNEVERGVQEPERSIVALDGELLVGHTTAFTLPMTIPGAPSQVAGVSMVAVRPTHRRRGILRQLMQRQLTDLHEAGAEPVATLTASEPVIYGRFGYGLASDHLRVTIPRGPGTLRPVAGTDEVTIRYADVAGSLDECLKVHQQVAGTRPGMFTIQEHWRPYVTLDSESVRGGGTPRRCVLAQRDGGTSGFAYFRTKRAWEDGRPRSSVQVDRVHATDLASYIALWELLLDQDLMVETTYARLPSDDPVLALLNDPRSAHPTLVDGLWARLVDVPRALVARTYESEVDVVLGVRDEICPWNAGAWRLVGGPDGATCERTAHEPDLVADVREFGAVYFGRPSLARLAAAGLVEERTPGALVQTSRAFRTEQLPWLDTSF